MKQPNWKQTAVVAVLILSVMSLGKFALYEFSGAAPNLRKSIGKSVILPQQTLHVNWKNITSGPHEGILEGVSYRWNDKVGFFDLRADYSGGSTGLSPFDAMKVKIMKPQQPPAGERLKAPPEE